jgi:dCMP deaminase
LTEPGYRALEDDARPTWDHYFMAIAELAATRSTCLRRQVGAVIVRDRRILATGYNGAPAGLPHCSEVGCLREKLGVPSGERHELCRGIHAEQNALLQSCKTGTVVAGGTIYVTATPCILCAKMLINAGIVRVVSRVAYPDDLAREFLADADVSLEVLPEDR